MEELIKNKNIYWILFALMILAQIVVPTYMVLSSDKTITEGRIYKFELQAIDPYDPFRGKYIILEPKENYLEGYEAECTACKLYATFTEDADGFAQLASLSRAKPQTDNFIHVESQSNDTVRNNKRGTIIAYPFRKYFLNEKKAKPAEDLIRSMTRDSSVTTYANVAVLNGHAQVLDIMIGDDNLLDLIDF